MHFDKESYIKFQFPSSSGSLVLKQTKGATDRWTDADRQMDGWPAQTNMHPQLLPIFKWHYYFSRRTPVQNYFEIHE